MTHYQKKMLTNKRFFVPYLHSMLIASMTFGVIRSMYMLLISIVNSITAHNLVYFHFSGTITIVVLAIIQSAFFFIIGMLVAYFPSRIVVKDILLPRSKCLLSYLFAGALLGILSLPLCAAVAFLVPYAPDLPGYLARCAEYALPMIFAGAMGGYFFGRSQSCFMTK